jgi:hypothetical protein
MIDTVKGHYDALSVLSTVNDLYAKDDLAWRINEDATGFVSA